MDVSRETDRPTGAASPDYFTGTVFFDPIVTAPEPARVRASKVSFAPGARTAWHTHPLGQTLYVVSGVGRICKEGDGVQEIRAGDTVWIPPDIRHWHGAAPDHAMTHIAIHEALNGKHIDWQEHVTDAQYSSSG